MSDEIQSIMDALAQLRNTTRKVTMIVDTSDGKYNGIDLDTLNARIANASGKRSKPLVIVYFSALNS